MSDATYISQTGFRVGDSVAQSGTPIRPGLWIDYHPNDDGDFLTPEEALELYYWLQDNYVKEGKNNE